MFVETASSQPFVHTIFFTCFKRVPENENNRPLYSLVCYFVFVSRSIPPTMKSQSAVVIHAI